jgi:hypothetical protein
VSDRELEALREAWGALPPNAPGPDCSPPDAIWNAVAGHHPETEVQAMLAHSVGCADCAALWRLARELQVTEREEASPAPVVPLRPRSWRWLAGGGALAAAALLAVVLVPRIGQREAAPVVRGRDDGLLRPDPAAETLDRAHPVLRWSGAPQGSRYSVVVSARDLTVLYRRSGLDTPELELPAEALTGVPPGGDVVWRVEAIAPGGRRISSGAFLSKVR